MRITREDIANGEIIPRWYAVAYNLDYNDVAVCYPVGIHLIVMAWEWLHWKVAHGKHYTLMRAPMRLAYHAGFKDACERIDNERISIILFDHLESLKREGRP